ncbi:hypothetical protein [Vibrio parahaemolyticus]
MSKRHLSAAMKAAEIMRNGRKEAETFYVQAPMRRRKRSVREIREMMIQASINRSKDLA